MSSQTDEKNSEATPEFFRMESFRREEFLSQIGSFSQVQYQLFHNICDFWQPALDYNHFILKSSKSALAANNQLEILMNKLREAHVGLLQFDLVGGELKPGRIILADKESFHFYYYAAEDLLARNISESGHPFITLQTFEKTDLILPGTYITPLEPALLSPGFIGKTREDPVLYGLSRKNRSPLLIPSGKMDLFITSLINYLRRELESPNLMEHVSRISEKKISDIQKNITTRDPSFWISFCKCLLEQREDLKLRLKGLSPLIFTSAQLLYAFFYNSLTELKQKQQEETARQKSMLEIVSEIKDKETRWTSLHELDEGLKKGEEKWKGFREGFRDSFLKRQEGKEQPELILINGQVIHRDYMFRYFSREITDQGRRLQLLYQDMMSDLLRHGQTDKYTQFYSRNNFRADILNRIRDNAPQVKELLQKPTLVAESAFYYLKELKGIKETPKIKDTLSLYFKEDFQQFQNIDSILNLNLMSLFDKAFRELGWWGRVLLRISGRYDSYTNVFSGKPSSAAGKMGRKQAAGGFPAARRPPRPEPSPGERPVRSRTNQPAQPRPHSIREKRKAWDEFSDAVQKKK